MKSFTVSIPTSRADLLSLCESAGRMVRRGRTKTGINVAAASLRAGLSVSRAGQKAGSAIADGGYALGNAIASGELRGSTSSEASGESVTA